MIIEGLFNLISAFINLIPFSLPDLPDGVQNCLDILFNGIKDNLGLINIFINLKFWITLASVMVLIYNIKHVWNALIWLINLIPGVQIQGWK